jgi:integrase
MAGYMKDLGDGKFQFEVSKGHTGGGKRNKSYKTIQAKGKTPEAQHKYAEKQLALFVAEVENGTYVKPTNLTFSDYVEKWKVSASRDLAPKTYYRYNELLRLHILPKIGGYKLEEITATSLEDAYNELRQPMKRKFKRKDGKTSEKEYTLSEQTLKHIHRLIGSIMQAAYRKGLIRENPVARTEAPKVKKKEPKIYESDQIASLIVALEDTDIQFKTAVHVTLAAGCRLGELIGLEWQDIDYDKCTIEIRQAGQYLPGKGIFTKDPKNETSKRIVAMPVPVMGIIAQMEHKEKCKRVNLGNKWQGGDIKEKPEKQYEGRPNMLFTQADGSPIFPDTLSKQWRAFIKDKDLPKMTFHGLRHTSASYLIACGQDVVSVSKRLGHAKPSTTLSIYAHAFKKRDQESAKFMEGLYAKKEDKENKDNKAN